MTPFRETTRNSPKTGLQDEMVDFGKFGRFSRFRTVCFGGGFGFCWGGSRKKNGRKKYLTSNIVGNRAIEFESFPSKGFREHHWGCFEMELDARERHHL